jgi:hypothetical protein
MEHLLGWLKPLYELFGFPYPRVSLAAVMVLGAAFSGGVWMLVGKQAEKDHQLSVAHPPMSGPASTTGSESPAVSGNGNNVTYNNDAAPPGKKAETPAKKH